MYLLREPIEINLALSEFYEHAKESIDIAILGTSAKRWSQRAYQNLMTITFPDDSIEDVIEVVRDYPELNLLVMHYESLFVLIAPKNEWNRVCTLLMESGVRTFEEGPKIFTWTILCQLPSILEEHGLKCSDYRITYNSQSVDKLLSSWPVDCTLYSTSDGLHMVLRNSDALDLNVKQLPSGCEARIIAGNDYSVFNRNKHGGIA
jgi:hypothetical protein